MKPGRIVVSVPLATNAQTFYAVRSNKSVRCKTVRKQGRIVVGVPLATSAQTFYAVRSNKSIRCKTVRRQHAAHVDPDSDAVTVLSNSPNA